MMAVFTVTLNPAIDQTVMLDRLVPGEVHRARSVRQDAGGKGINAASCLADWDVPVTVMGLLGGANAAPFDALFAEKSIIDRCQRHGGSTRVNLKLVDVHGTTDINMNGAPATEARIDAVMRRWMNRLGPAISSSSRAACRPAVRPISMPPLPPCCGRGALSSCSTAAARRFAMHSPARFCRPS